MERLQQQLKSMKTFKMKKLNVGNDVGLVDSGATRPLRPRFEGEDTELYPVVEVSLADGRAVRLKMSPGGVAEAELQHLMGPGNYVHQASSTTASQSDDEGRLSPRDEGRSFDIDLRIGGHQAWHPEGGGGVQC